MNEIAADSTTPPPLVRKDRYFPRLAFRVLVYLLIYLVISIVMIGPCFWYWFEATYVGGPNWVARFFAPLVWFCDRCPPLGWLVNQYVNWWIG